MKKKFIFFLSQPIDERNLDRLGFKYLNKSYNCEIWDISLIFNRRIAKYQKKKNYNNKNLFLIKNKTEFFLKILKLNNFYFIDLSTYNNIFYLIAQIFAEKKGGTKISITGLNLPNEIFITKGKKFYALFFSFKFLSIINLFLNFFKNKLIKFLTPKPKVIFLSGNKDPKNFLLSKFKIESQCIDFDYYLKAKNFNKLKRGIVFLDQAFGDHPEYYLNTGKKNNFLNLYLNELHIFLNKISKQFKKKIYITLHPRASKNYNQLLKKKFCQKNFSITKNNSAKYISSSYFVICHMSSSHQIAVLSQKFIIFCYSKFFNEREVHYVKALASILGLPAIKMKEENFNTKLKTNKKKYKNYINKYITTNIKSKKISWEILIDSLRKIKIYE